MKTTLLRLTWIPLALFAVTTAEADIIRLDARPSWAPYPVAGDTVSVDVYLDCECAGGTPGDFSTQDEWSDYIAVQFSVLFDDQVYDYVPSLSLPNTLPYELAGAEDAGILAFSSASSSPSRPHALVISSSPYAPNPDPPLSGPVPYYGYALRGGPHPLKPGTTNQVLIQYFSIRYASMIGTYSGGEWPLGTLVFRIHTLGSPALIGARMPPEDMIAISNQQILTTTNGGVTVSGDFTIPAPEPARGTLLAAGIASLGLLARARRSRRMREGAARGEGATAALAAALALMAGLRIRSRTRRR